MLWQYMQLKQWAPYHANTHVDFVVKLLLERFHVFIRRSNIGANHKWLKYRIVGYSERIVSRSGPNYAMVVIVYYYSYSDISSPPHHTSYASDYG